MLLVVDNGSVFISNIVSILSKIKIEFTVIPFHTISDITLEKFDSFILSGRVKNNQKMNQKNSSIIKHAVSKKKSLLGICYGAEILALTLGGTIKRSLVVKGEQKIIITKQNPICENNAIVFQSHNYEISKLGNELSKIAYSETCKNEILQHNDLHIFGTQFHPEMTIDGQKMIEKFVSL
jgi:GMP synthase (glutamine-hydrolysing)